MGNHVSMDMEYLGSDAAMETGESPRRLGHRPVLDGLRGIAILLVMLTHTGVLPNGYVGVDLFFALSGFLITTLLYEEWDRAGRISLRRFYGRRARRLLPALGLLIAVALIVDLLCYPMTGWPFSEEGADLAAVRQQLAGRHRTCRRPRKPEPDMVTRAGGAVLPRLAARADAAAAPPGPAAVRGGAAARRDRPADRRRTDRLRP